MIRSGLSPSNTGPRPPPSPPIRRSSSSSTSSKKSVHCLSGPRYGIGICVAGEARARPRPRSRASGSPSVAVGAAGCAPPRARRPRARRPRCRSSGRAARSGRRARSTEVERLCEFVPASGSVIANAIFVVPAAMPRSQRSFCSSVPWRARMLPTIAGETTIRSSDLPAAAISSPTVASAGHAEPAAAPLLGQVHAEVALLGERVPQLGGRLAGRVLLARVVLGEAVADAAHGCADLALLVGRDPAGGRPGWRCSWRASCQCGAGGARSVRVP